MVISDTCDRECTYRLLFLVYTSYEFHLKVDYVVVKTDKGIPLTTTSLLGLRVRIPWEIWMYVPCECCVLSGGGLCDELITRPEKSECDVSKCNREGSTTRTPKPTRAVEPKKRGYFIDA